MSRPVESSYEDSQHLLNIDNTPLKRHAVHRFQRLLRQSEELSEELRRFEEIDMPAYTAWLTLHFNSMYERLDEAEQEVKRLEKRRININAIHLRDGIPLHEASKMVELGCYVELGSEQLSETVVDDTWKDEDEFSFDADEFNAGEDTASEFEDEFMDQVINEVMKLDQSEEWQELLDDTALLDDLLREYSRRRQGGDNDINVGEMLRRWQQNDKSHELIEIKKIYKKLARQLHPDRLIDRGNPSLNALWQRTQNAYLRRDLHELSHLELLSAVWRNAASEVASLSALLRLYRDNDDDLQKLRQQHRLLSKEDAWQFTRKSIEQIKQLKRYHQRQMERELRQRLRKIKQLRAILDNWAIPSELLQTVSPPPRRRQLNYIEQELF